MPISQADLPDFVGATCEGVAKILAEWRVLGWVAQSRGTVRIVDRPAPDAIANADID
ncbi:MAG: helix-turn-helix domain-containing protein [Rhodospirillales bacterium]|nr:helix-turn-helix domain-containing protein [Rhodospirillales bacterium]